jgi:DNA polymerase-4
VKHRKILHLDLDAFFCAVEEERDPSLRGKAFAVGGRPDERGVVASCSYAARRFGVRSAMPMSRALKLCPGLLIVPSRHKAYQAASQKVMARLGALTPLVEQISIDEAFLDLSDLPESGETLARQLQAIVRDELGLPCSVGVATNKLLAKIATDVGKAANKTGGYPNAIMVVPPGQEAAFLAPLPAQSLWGVGPKTAEALASLGLHTIGDLARWPSADLARRFGKVGADLAQRARGLDDRPVVTSHEAKSISQETTFARDVKDGKTLRDTLRDLSDQVGRRLRQSGLSGATVKLKLRWPDFTTLTRQTTLSQPTDQGDEIYNAVTRLFDDVWRPGKAVRLLGVAVTGLGTSVQQLSLLDEGSEKKRRLQTAIDELRERFGSRAVQRASQLEDEE